MVALVDGTGEIEDVYQRIGDVVRSLRSEAGWTQADLACQVGLTRASIANVELGRQRLMLHQIVSLADVFSVPVGQIIGEAVMQFPVSEHKLREKISELKSENERLRGSLRRIWRDASEAAQPKNP